MYDMEKKTDIMEDVLCNLTTIHPKILYNIRFFP